MWRNRSTSRIYAGWIFPNYTRNERQWSWIYHRDPERGSRFNKNKFLTDGVSNGDGVSGIFSVPGGCQNILILLENLKKDRMYLVEM